jgi:hypothetical protein
MRDPAVESGKTLQPAAKLNEWNNRQRNSSLPTNAPCLIVFTIHCRVFHSHHTVHPSKFFTCNYLKDDNQLSVNKGRALTSDKRNVGIKMIDPIIPERTGNGNPDSGIRDAP